MSGLPDESFREVKATFRERMSDLLDHDKSILRLFIDAPEKLFDDSGSERVKISREQKIFLFNHGISTSGFMANDE